MFRNISLIKNALLGEPSVRQSHHEAIVKLENASQSLQYLPQGDPASDPEQPIFILSAGWRSGSTLLQRLICSDPSILIWGEPYDKCAFIQRLSEAMAAFSSTWPPEQFLINEPASRDLSGSWIANLYPTLFALRQAHREFFISLFGIPAYERGYTRWGIKEVRLNANHIAYLKWLFPGARFLFLVRNPYSAYRSYRQRGRRWYMIWPNQPVFNSYTFGRHWNTLANDFRKLHDQNAGYLIYYEQLEEQNVVLDDISSYISSHVDKSVLDQFIGGSRTDRDTILWIPKVELLMLRQAVSPLAQELGYTM